MKTISQYREDIKALMKKAADIDAKITNESRDPQESELSLKNEILDTVEDLQKIVANLERQDRISRQLDGPATQPATRPSPQAQAEQDNRERFGSLGQQLAAIMRAGTPGGSIDPRLLRGAAATGLNETVPSDGGFLVQQDFATVLLQDVFQTGILASRCRRIPI